MTDTTCKDCGGSGTCPVTQIPGDCITCCGTGQYPIPGTMQAEWLALRDALADLGRQLLAGAARDARMIWRAVRRAR